MHLRAVLHLINWSRDLAVVEGRPATRERMPVKPPPLISIAKVNSLAEITHPSNLGLTP